MNELLKGNFQVKNPVSIDQKAESQVSIEQALRERALSSIGGSMVYVERTPLAWDGEDE